MVHKVLVVEDDLLNRMFLCDALRHHGYDVRVVSDGAHVMEAVREFEPDLVTMDINIPHIPGTTLIRKMKRDGSLRHIPVLAITAYAGPMEEKRICGAGASHYMTKPIAVHSLLESVSGLLAGEAGQLAVN